MRALAVLLVLGLLAGAVPVAAQGWVPQLYVQPGRVEVAPGAQFRGEATVANTGPSNMTVSLSMDPGDVYGALDATTMSLAPYEMRRVGFFVSVPTSHAPGYLFVRFSASGVPAMLVLNVTDAAPQSFDAGLLPGTSPDNLGDVVPEGGSFSDSFVVMNLNNTTKTYPVRARAPLGWTVSVSTSSLTLGPRQNGTVTVSATPTPEVVNGTGAIEIGDPRAHTAVALYLNTTHPATAKKPAHSILTIDPTTADVQAGGSVGASLTIANDGDLAWSDEVMIAADPGLTVEGPARADVPPHAAVALDYTIRADASMGDGDADVRFFTNNSNATIRLHVTRAPTPANLSVALDKSEVDVEAGERAAFNVTVTNDGDEPATGTLDVVAPLGLALNGSATFTVAGHASVALPYLVTGTADGNVTFAAAGSPAARLAVRVRSPLPPPAPSPVLNVTLDPATLAIEAGETHLVRVTVSNAGDGAWRGQLEIRTFGNATAQALTTTLLDVAPGGSAGVNVRVSRAGGGEAYAQFAALDAQATLVLDDTTARPLVSKTEAGGVGAIAPPVAVALVAAGVGIAAGGVAFGQRRWPLLFAGLYARLAPSRLLEHPMRARIRRLVDENPGVTRNEVGRRLGLAPGALDHHLAKLLSGGFIVAVPDGQLRRLFVPGSARPEARAALDERILAHLRAHGPASASDVAQALGASRQALHYHLRRMAREGSVVVERGPRGLTLRAP